LQRKSFWLSQKIEAESPVFALRNLRSKSAGQKRRPEIEAAPAATFTTPASVFSRQGFSNRNRRSGMKGSNISFRNACIRTAIFPNPRTIRVFSRPGFLNRNRWSGMTQMNTFVRTTYNNNSPW
jgi:hypothetical protein